MICAMMREQLEVAFSSVCGQRKNNEDMLGVPAQFGGESADDRLFSIPATPQARQKKGHLFLVADGVGGNDGGEVASHFVVSTVAERYYDDPSEDLPTSLRRVIEGCNRSLCQAQQTHYPRMSTTLVAAVIEGERLILANVGDSRAYIISTDNQIIQLTGDHSRASQWRAQNKGEETLAAADRHRITRSLGRGPSLGVDVWVHSLKPGQKLLLCSDGLNPALEQLADRYPFGRYPLSRQLHRLIQLASDLGSRDNITALLVAVNE